MKDSIKLDQDQYLIIKAMFNACSKDFTTRVTLLDVFYDSERGQLIATDGHILRVYKIDLGKINFLLKKDHFSITKTQFPKLYPEGEIEIPIDTENAKDYPNYNRILEGFSPGDRAFMGLDLELLDCFKKTLPAKETKVILRFSDQLGSIQVYTCPLRDDEPEFLGVIMPLRIYPGELVDSWTKKKTKREAALA